MRKVFKGFWFVAVVLLLLFLYFPTLSKYLKLKRQEEGLNQEVAELKTKIEELKKEENLIKHDPDHLEQVMRKELGLVKPGEVVYKLVPEEKVLPEENSEDSSAVVFVNTSAHQ